MERDNKTVDSKLDFDDPKDISRAPSVDVALDDERYHNAEPYQEKGGEIPNTGHREHTSYCGGGNRDKVSFINMTQRLQQWLLGVKNLSVLCTGLYYISPFKSIISSISL